MANKKHPYHRIRAEVFAERGMCWQTPIKIVEGDQPPRKEGQEGGFDKRVLINLPDGSRLYVMRRVLRPCKGSWKYHRSTLHITVGIDWCKEHAPEAVSYFAAKRLGVKR